MLTLEQINQIRAKSGLPPKATSSQQNYVGKYDYLKPKPSFIDTVKESAANRIGDAREALSGDTNPVSAGLRFWGAGAGLVGDVIGAGIQKVAPGVTEKIGEVAGKVMETQPAQNILSSYQDFKMKYPEAAKDLEATTNILSLLPAGKGAQVAGKAAVAGTELAEQGARITLAGTGKVLEKSGEKVFKSSIPLSKVEAGMVQSYKAKNPLLQRIFDPISKQPRTAAITALEKGFAGSEQRLGIQAKREATNLWKNKIEPAVNSIPEKYDIQGAIKNVEAKVAKTADPSRRAALNDAVMALKEDYKGFSKVSYSKAQQIKSDMAKFLPDKAFKGKPIGSAFKDIQNMLIKDIRDKTYNALKDVDIKTDYLDYGNLIKLQEFGQKAMTGAKSKGGFGSFVSNLYDAATTPAKTFGGQILYKSGKALQKSADNFKLKAGLSIEDIRRNKLPSPINSTNNTLIQEARKYKSADEFVKFMRGSATQYGEYNPKLRAKIGLFEDSARLSDLGIDPNKEITIYRGIDGNIKGAKINDGDFITTDLESAKGYSGGKVISKKVKAKDLIADSAKEFDVNDPFYTGAEFIYSDSKNKLTNYTKSQLTDIWNKANKKTAK